MTNSPPVSCIREGIVLASFDPVRGQQRATAQVSV